MQHPELYPLIQKIIELTKDDPTRVTFTNGYDFWIIINNHPCMVAPDMDSLYIPGLTERDLEM